MRRSHTILPILALSIGCSTPKPAVSVARATLSVPPDCRILALQSEGDYATPNALDESLTRIGVAHTALTGSDAVAGVATLNLTDYDVIMVGSQDDGWVDGEGITLAAQLEAALLARKGELDSWVRSGKGLIVLADQYNPGDPYPYLPLQAQTSGAGRYISGEGVATSVDHPILSGLSSDALSNWGDSWLNWFQNWAPEYQVLAVQLPQAGTSIGGNPVLLAAQLDNGRIAVTQLAPDLQTVENDGLIPGTTQLLSNMLAWACPSNPVKVKAIRPNQAVDAMPLVAGKPPALVRGRETRVRVELDLALAHLDPSQPIDVELDFGGQPQTQSTTVADARVDFFVTPANVGNWTIDVRIDPAGKLGLTGELTRSLDVDVEEPNPLTVAFVAMDDVAPPTAYGSTTQTGLAYVQAVFPVGPSSLVRTDEIYIPTPPSNPPPPPLANGCPGIDRASLVATLKSLALSASVSAAPLKRVVGIAPQAWFDARHLPGSGWTLAHPPASVVKDGHPDAIPHELGHSFGFNDSYTYQKEANGAPALTPPPVCGPTITGQGAPASSTGYWVEQRRDESGCIEYMGLGYGCSSPQWTTDEHWQTLFNKFVGNLPDPDVLVVSGLIDKNGGGTLDPLYRNANGVASSSSGAEASVRVVDAQGATLAEVGFAGDYELHGPTTEISDVAPFIVSVPFLAGADQVQLVRGGSVVASQRVVPELLRTAVRQLPDALFGRQTARRAALANKVDALAASLAAGDVCGARNQLVNDLRKQATSWLSDAAVSSPLQLSRASLLALIDALVARAPMSTCATQP